MDYLAATRLEVGTSWAFVLVLGLVGAVALVQLARRHHDSAWGWLIAGVVAFGLLHGVAFGKLYVLAVAGADVEADVVRLERHDPPGRRRAATTFEVEARVETGDGREAVTLRDTTSEAFFTASTTNKGDLRPGVRAPFVLVRWWPSLHQIGFAPGLEAWRVVLGFGAVLMAWFTVSGGLRRLEYDLGRLMVGLAAVLGGTLSMALTMLASFAAAGVAMRRERGEPIELFDAGCVVVLGAILFVQVRGIVRPRMREMTIKGGAIDVPSTSWAHALYDAGLLAMGATFLNASIEGPHRVDGRGWDLGLGIGFLVVTGLLLVLRIVFWRRRPRP